MTAAKNLGIWMDHANAHLVELSIEPRGTIIMQSKFTHEVREQGIRKSESLMHNKEQHETLSYYKKLGEVIKNYDSVVIFGPTHAKDELYNLLLKDHHFSSIKIYTRHADRMSENQEHAFVKDFFSNMPVAVENNIF